MAEFWWLRVCGVWKQDVRSWAFGFGGAIHGREAQEEEQVWGTEDIDSLEMLTLRCPEVCWAQNGDSSGSWVWQVVTEAAGIAEMYRKRREREEERAQDPAWGPSILQDGRGPWQEQFWGSRAGERNPDLSCHQSRSKPKSVLVQRCTLSTLWIYWVQFVQNRTPAQQWLEQREVYRPNTGSQDWVVRSGALLCHQEPSLSLVIFPLCCRPLSSCLSPRHGCITSWWDKGERAKNRPTKFIPSQNHWSDWVTWPLLNHHWKVNEARRPRVGLAQPTDIHVIGHVSAASYNIWANK